MPGAEQRHRSLPARVMAYFSIGLALHSEGSYEDVFAQLTYGLSWASGRSQSWSPPSKSAIFQARVVALAECGTRAILDAEIGPCSTSEIALSRELAGRFTTGMLVLVGRGFYGFRLWQHAADTGADLLWRVKTNLRPRRLETLTDGSWLAQSSQPSIPNGGKSRPPSTN
ncbi:MAG: transposase domain-containing protein [Lacisediminihabitans sp.]